jgi:hypothetical protein
MDFNKRREASSMAYWRISRSWIVLHHVFELNQPRETRMSDLGYQFKGSMETARSDCRPKEGKVVQKTQASRGDVYFCCCLALFAYEPLVWHLELSNLT